MLLFFAISGFVNGITFAILGLLVFLDNPKRKLNRLYALFSFSVVFWAISYGIWLLAKDYETGLFWARMLNFGALFIFIFFSHWILTFLEIEKERRNQIILILGYLVTLVFALFAFTPYYVSHVEPKIFFPYWPMSGILHHFYLLFCWGGLLGYTFYQLWKAYKKASGYKKEQLKYILVGGLIGFGGGATNYFLWYGIPIAPWGNPLVFTWSIILTYTILRYRFMDIRLVLSRGAVYLLSFATVIAMAFLLMFLNRQIGIPISNNIALPLILIISILLFQPIFRLFEKIASKYFYYTFYNTQVVLTDLGKKLIQILELDKVSSLIIDTLIKTIKPDKISFAFKQPTSEFYQFQKTIGFDEKEIASLIRDTFLCSFLEKTKKILVEGELSSILEKTKDEKEWEDLKILKEKLKINEVNLVLPLFQKGKIVGILFLGEKLSSNPYTKEDIEILENLSYQMAISLQNSLLYEEIKKDKEILEKFYKLIVGRELRMAELKQKIKELEEKLKEKEEKM